MIKYILTTIAILNFSINSFRYLEDSVMNLDMSDMVTREHMSSVVGELCEQISNFLHTEKHHAMTKQMRMLLMASQSMLK